MNKGLRWKETIAGVEAPNLMVVETQLPAGRNQTFATAADIVQCLKANPEALTPEQWAEVLRDYPEVKRYCIAQTFLGSEGYWVSCEARASRAEQALATVTAERDDAMTLAEERRDYARAQNAKLSVECDDLRARLAKTERVVEAAREDAQHCPHACSPPCPFDRAVARTRAALRALDSPVVAGTDSGGSGAAPNPGEAASAIGNGPEPAGSSQNSPVGVAATAEDGHEAPARNRQPVEPPSDPATGTTRREPPETDRTDGSTGAVALCGEWLPAANSTCALPRGHDGVHDPWAPGVKSPTLREIHATTRREVEALRQAMITRAELEELRRRVSALEDRSEP